MLEPQYGLNGDELSIFDTAEQNCLEILHEIPHDYIIRSKIYEYIGDLYSRRNDINSANRYYNLSLFSNPISKSLHKKKLLLPNKDNMPVRTISVVVPTFNRYADLVKCVRDIRKNTYFPVQIVVVCDKCSDGSLEFIVEENNKTDFIGIINKSKLGCVKSIKLGLYAAEGDYVAIINDDVQVMPGWDFQIIRFIDNDEYVGCALPLVVNPDGTVQSVGQHNSYRSTRYDWIGRVKSFDHNSAVGMNLSDFKQFHNPRECDYGYFPVLKRRCMEKIGFIDESYNHYYYDPDLGYMVQKNGYKNVFCPTSVFIHHQKSLDEYGALGVQRKAQKDLKKFIEKWSLL